MLRDLGNIVLGCMILNIMLLWVKVIFGIDVPVLVYGLGPIVTVVQEEQLVRYYVGI